LPIRGLRHIHSEFDTRQVYPQPAIRSLNEHADDGRRREGLGRSDGLCRRRTAARGADPSAGAQPRRLGRQPAVPADDMAEAQLEAGTGLRTLIHMDDPHHRKVRAIGADWFRPKAMRDLKVQVDRLAKRYVDRLREIGPECDFVTEIAVNFPLYVIMSLLGLPEDDFPRMHMLTQEMFGGDDEEYNKRGKSPEEQLTILLDFFTYFSELTASRREHPTEDLASAIANGRVDGEPLSDVDTASYYVIVASAGHDTTKDAISGGLLALIENPSELERLRQNMDLMPTAVEEMVRWAT